MAHCHWPFWRPWRRMFIRDFRWLMRSAMCRVSITISEMTARYGDWSQRGGRHRSGRLPNGSSIWLYRNSQITRPSLRHLRIRQPVRRYPVVALRQRLKEFTLRGSQTLNRNVCATRVRSRWNAPPRRDSAFVKDSSRGPQGRRSALLAQSTAQSAPPAQAMNLGHRPRIIPLRPTVRKTLTVATRF